MKSHGLKFPLVNSFTIALPAGTVIAGVSIENDVARLNLENFPYEAWSVGREWHGPAGKLETDTRKIQVFLEGEKRVVEIKGGPDDGKKFEEEIPIPEASEKLHKLGVVETIDPPGKFHVFIQIS